MIVAFSWVTYDLYHQLMPAARMAKTTVNYHFPK